MQEGVTTTGQVRLADLFVLTSVLAAYGAQFGTGSLNLGDLSLCLTIFAVWNRPLVFRFWACGLAAYGAGLFFYGIYDGSPVKSALNTSFGAAILTEAIAAIFLFRHHESD